METVDGFAWTPARVVKLRKWWGTMWEGTVALESFGGAA